MAGADAIGLIFYQGSSRCVTVAQAREILEALPPLVTPVALFVDQKPAEIRDITEQLSIRNVQLHGEEPLEYLNELSNLTIIKALQFNPDTIVELVQKWTDAAGLLMETASKIAAGGTGIENNWEALETVKNDGHFMATRLIAAGGLKPGNVGDVVRRLRPWAVDVSTGIEESRGIKSADKMQRFAQAVREADQS